MTPNARTTRTVAMVLSIVLVAVIGMPIASWAAQQFFALAPGDSLTVSCDTRLSGRVRGKQSVIECIPPTTGTQPTATALPPTATQAMPTATALPTVVVPTATPSGQQQPVAGQLCPDWVHDQYMVTGPDGNLYRTWHPPVDAQYGCYYGHEHGQDPRLSRADSSLPAFGYAAKLLGIEEPHEGFKVFLVNAGPITNPNEGRVAMGDYRYVFHMGTSRLGRYTTRFHSMEYDYIARDGSSRTAHVYGMADTGIPIGAVCDLPRQGGRDFSTIGCDDPYEIWSTGFNIQHVDDPFQNEVMQVRLHLGVSVAAFDPITTRDPSNNSALIYTQSYRRPNSNVDPLSTHAEFRGCAREFYAGATFFENANRPSVYYTDPYGYIQPGPGPGLIRQEFSAISDKNGEGFKVDANSCDDTVRAPN